jgi:hypothetical protein
MKASYSPARIRISMGLAACILFGIEITIALTHHGDWIRNSLGDILVMPLLYSIARCMTPRKPQYGWMLPLGLLVFSFLVEGLQGIRIADILNITNPILRTIIGTTFVPTDFLYYTIGILPAFIPEYFLRKKRQCEIVSPME